MAGSSPGSDRGDSPTAGPRGAPSGLEHKLTYQVILRHLAKLRDGAHRLLDLFREHAPWLEEETRSASMPAPEAAEVAPEPVPKSPLEVRIERHLGAVDQALIRLNKLNPDHRRMAELPVEIREQIALQERTIHDIVAAELHFWAAAIENASLEKFDPIEQTWIARIIRLAHVIGVDADHEEHLEFLEGWAS